MPWITSLSEREWRVVPLLEPRGIRHQHQNNQQSTHAENNRIWITCSHYSVFLIGWIFITVSSPDTTLKIGYSNDFSSIPIFFLSAQLMLILAHCLLFSRSHRFGNRSSLASVAIIVGIDVIDIGVRQRTIKSVLKWDKSGVWSIQSGDAVARAEAGVWITLKKDSIMCSKFCRSCLKQPKKHFSISALLRDTSCMTQWALTQLLFTGFYSIKQLYTFAKYIWKQRSWRTNTKSMGDIKINALCITFLVKDDEVLLN